MSLFLFACADNKETVIETWDNGNIKAKKIYYNDRDTAQFLLLTYYSDGEIKERTQYQSTTKSGWGINYYNNGQVRDSIFYRNNIPATSLLSFYTNGKLAISGIYNDFGKKDGWWTFYDTLGGISKLTEFTNDIEQTKTFHFDKNGWMIKEIERFNEGPIGDINEENNYKDSVLHGQYIKYFENGNLEKTGEFINGGRKNTTWTEFYKSGKKFREYLFTDNKGWTIKLINMWDKDGIQTVKDGKGKHVTYEYCQNGKPKTKMIVYYKNGQITENKFIRVSACR